MDFWIEMGITALLRLLRDEKQSKGYRRALLKVFREIGRRFADDEEFRSAAALELRLRG